MHEEDQKEGILKEKIQHRSVHEQIIIVQKCTANVLEMYYEGSKRWSRPKRRHLQVKVKKEKPIPPGSNAEKCMKKIKS